MCLVFHTHLVCSLLDVLHCSMKIQKVYRLQQSQSLGESYPVPAQVFPAYKSCRRQSHRPRCLVLKTRDGMLCLRVDKKKADIHTLLTFAAATCRYSFITFFLLLFLSGPRKQKYLSRCSHGRGDLSSRQPGDSEQ